MPESLTGGGGNFASFPEWDMKTKQVIAGFVQQLRHDVGQYKSSVCHIVAVRRPEIGQEKTEIYTVWFGTTMMKDAASKLNENDYIQITFKGWKQGKSNKFKDIEVIRMNDSVQPEIAEKAKAFYDKTVAEQLAAKGANESGNTASTTADDPNNPPPF